MNQHVSVQDTATRMAVWQMQGVPAAMPTVYENRRMRQAHMNTWIAELRAQQNQASPEGPNRTTAHQTGKNLRQARSTLMQPQVEEASVTAHCQT